MVYDSRRRWSRLEGNPQIVPHRPGGEFYISLIAADRDLR